MLVYVVSYYFTASPSPSSVGDEYSQQDPYDNLCGSGMPDPITTYTMPVSGNIARQLLDSFIAV